MRTYFCYYAELLKQLHDVETIEILIDDIRKQALKLIRSGELATENDETVECLQYKIKIAQARLVEIA